MKVVYYHADARALWDVPAGLYKRIARRFLENCEQLGLEVIHLTLDGCEGWGHRSVHYPDLDPAQVVYNREVCFTAFLRTAPEGEYLFTEPDSQILRPVEPTAADCMMLYRADSGPHLCPALRLARPSALPVFQRVRDAIAVMTPDRRAWHGDSVAFADLYTALGQPTATGTYTLGDVSIELRAYADYMKGPAMRFWKNSRKLEMVQ